MPHAVAGNEGQRPLTRAPAPPTRLPAGRNGEDDVEPMTEAGFVGLPLNSSKTSTKTGRAL